MWRDTLRSFVLPLTVSILASLSVSFAWKWHEMREREIEIACPILNDVKIVAETTAALERGTIFENESWPSLPTLSNIHPMIPFLTADIRAPALGLLDKWQQLHVANIKASLSATGGRAKIPPMAKAAHSLALQLQGELSKRCGG
jgi:hypothetical protein